MHGYTHCPGNPSNSCVYARKCPYHGDSETCAQDVHDCRSDKERTRRRRERKAARAGVSPALAENWVA